MQKQLIIAVVAILLIGGGIFLFTQSGSGSPLSNITNKSGDLGMVSGTLEDLFAKGVPMTCTFEYNDDDGSVSKGTVYVSGENMRGEFMMTMPNGEEIQSYMIRRGDESYTWSSESDTGMKMTISDFEGDNDAYAENQEDDTYAMQNEDVDYDCKPWVPNNAQFTPPSDIEFTDFSKQMEQFEDVMEESGMNSGGMEEGVEDSMEYDEDAMKDASCAACDQAPTEESRQQCRSALSCP